MNKEELISLKQKIANLSKEDKTLRNMYLRDLSKGYIQGPVTGYPSIDKPWLKFYEESAIKDEILSKNIYEYLVNTSKDRMDLVALNYYGKKITYGQLLQNIERVAKSFENLGIKKGDVVSLCLPALPETMYIFFALNKIGAISNMIDPRITSNQILKFVNESKSKILISINMIDFKIKEIYDDLNIEQIISVSATNSLPVFKKIAKNVIDRMNNKSRDFFRSINWSKFLNSASYKLINPISDESKFNTVAEIVYTTGTTGTPKGAILTNENMIAMVREQVFGLPQMQPGEKFLDIMPPFIAYGSLWGMIIPLMAGLELIIIPKFDMDKFDELLMTYKPSYIMGVPSFYEKLLKSALLKDADLSFLKCPIAGGNSMTPTSEVSVNEFLKNHNCKAKMLKGYGMTEVSSAITFPVQEDSNKVGSVGNVLSKSNIKVIDPATGIELKYNEKGELWLTGPTVIDGYLNNQIEQDKTFITDSNGVRWVKSGDIGYIDKDGCVFITGRIKRSIIRTDGHNVYPQEIENIISMHKAVDSCCVIGIKSPEFENGVIATAYVVLNEEYAKYEFEIEQSIREFSLKYLQPRDIAEIYVFGDSIPLIDGKIDYRKVEQIVTEKLNNEKLKKYLKK